MAMFFTPALTALLGHTAWWPGHADVAKNAESGRSPQLQTWPGNGSTAEPEEEEAAQSWRR
jgi:RND superfamily putative drug exporter